jgi:hypothetical protein
MAAESTAPPRAGEGGAALVVRDLGELDHWLKEDLP